MTMLYITSLGETVLSARLTEKDALQVARDTIHFPEFEADQLSLGESPNEKLHRYLDPESQKWVPSGYKITTVPNPMTQHARDRIDMVLDAAASAQNGSVSHAVVGYEWGVRIEDASGIERILDPDSLEITARNRLEQYRNTWPTARLVRRPVYDEPWEESSGD
jgi:hypothetical protein